MKKNTMNKGVLVALWPCRKTPVICRKVTLNQQNEEMVLCGTSKRENPSRRDK